MLGNIHGDSMVKLYQLPNLAFFYSILLNIDKVFQLPHDLWFKIYTMIFEPKLPHSTR